MERYSPRCRVLSLLAVLLPLPAFELLAQTSLADPLDYPTPGENLLGQNGGTGFDGPWFASGFNASIHDNHDVAAGSLDFEALAVTGNRLQSAATNAIAGLGRNLAVPIAANDTTTIYFSLLLRPEGTLGTGVFNGFFGVYLDGTNNSDLFVGKPGSAAASNYVIENRGGAGQVQSGTAPVIDETVLLVVRADLGPGVDVFTLYVNPDPCQPEPLTGAVKNDLDLGDITAIVIYSTGAFGLDELRLAASFEAVVPCAVREPFAYARAGAALLGQEGGSGFAGPWFPSGFNAAVNENFRLAADSLSFATLPVTGNRVQTPFTNVIAGLGRNLAAPLLAAKTTTVFLSLLLRPQGTLGQGAFNGFFGVYLDGTGDSDLFVGKPGSAVAGRYAIENRGGAGQRQSGTAPVINETVLLVLRADLRPGRDNFTLYVNPDPCQSEPAKGTVKNDLDLGDVTAVVIYSSGAFSLDELRMGPSFENVVRSGGLTCPPSPDCNGNGIVDGDDIRGGFSEDVNGNGVPDECEPPTGGRQIPADCNQDGQLDISDGVCLLGFLFLGTPRLLACADGSAAAEGNLALLDSNGDGAIDLSDATRVFGYLFLGQPPPVLGASCTRMVGCPPGPQCGR